MPWQSAYDPQSPNGTARQDHADRTTSVFRVYRKQAAQLSQVSGTNNPLAPVQNAVRTATNFLTSTLGALQGKVLEHEFQLVLPLERLQEVPELRTQLHYVREGYFIDTLPNGRGVTTFRLAGRTHFAPVFVDGVPVDGDAALKELKELVDDLFYPRDGSVPSDFELYWLNFQNPISAEDPFGETEWLIWPLRNGVRTHKAANRPFTTFFEFEFAGLQSNRDKAKADDGFLSGLLGAGFLSTLLGRLGLSGLSGLLGGIFGTLKDVQTFLTTLGNVVTAVTDYVRGAQQYIQGSIGVIRSLLTSVQTIIGRLDDGISLVKQLPDLGAADLTRLTRDFPGLGRSGDVTPAIVTADEMRKVQDLLLALNAQPQLFAPPLTTVPQPSQTRAVKIPPQATIEDLAQTYNTDVDTLIALNGLRWPYVDARPNPGPQLTAAQADIQTAQTALVNASAALDEAVRNAAPAVDLASLQYQVDAARRCVTAANAAVVSLQASAPAVTGVLYAGDTLRVPQLTAPLQTPTILEISPALESRIATLFPPSLGLPAVTVEDRLFGFDLLLDDDGNLEWDTETLELMFVRGLDAITAVQQHYVKLPLGQLRYAPGIGNFAYADLGQWQGPAANYLLAFAMYKTLIQDPRVATIRNITAETFDGVATLSHDLVLINGQAVPDIRVPVPA